MNRSTNYSKMSSLSQVRAERGLLNSLIAHKEIQLEMDYNNFKDSLKPAKIISSLISNISILYPFFTIGKRIWRAIVNFYKTENVNQNNTQ